MEKELEELKRLRGQERIKFLKKLTQYKEENSPVYEKAIADFFSHDETPDAPVDVMRADEGEFGPKELKIKSEGLSTIQKPFVIDWTLIGVIFFSLVIITVFIMLILVNI